MVVGDGEGHQAFERHTVAAVFGEQLRCDAGIHLHARFEDKALLDTEAAGHLSGAFALLDQGGKRLKLVGGVHGQPDRVFSKAHLKSLLFGDDLARNREILRQFAFGL